jgi:UPF0755 protein
MKGRLTAFLSVFYVLLTLGLYFLFLMPVKRGDTVAIVVRKGESARSVAEKLVKEGVIDRAFPFLFLAKITGLEDDIKYGKHILGKKLPAFRTLWALTRENAGRVEEVVTIFEGSTLREIARTLNYWLQIDTIRFLELCHDPVFIKRLSFKFPLLDNPPSLEGYLFPDTYRFLWGDSEEKIIETMVGRLFEIWSPRYSFRAESLKMNLHQILTLASIIEEEAAIEKERFLISAVFHNRLKRGKHLESCATIEYILPKRKARLTYSDLKIDSPYNTYMYKGLPPTPICSPGLMSIYAALYPAPVKYLYFVSKGDGTHLFAVTWREHERNRSLVRRMLNP